MKREDKKQKQNKPKTLNDIYNSSNRYSMDMENVRFNYDDHIANFLEREKAKGKHAYNIASQKVDSSYSDRLYGNAYGIRNPELIEGLDYQHYSNPFERQYQINKRKNAPRVSVITKKPAKFQTNLDANGASSSHFNESNGWQKAQGWTDEFSEGVTKNWNDSRVKGMLGSVGSYLGAKFAKWSYGKIVAASAATTALTVGLYSGYKKLKDE